MDSSTRPSAAVEPGAEGTERYCPVSGTRRYDVVLRNGTVIDGSGAPGFIADVAITDDRIVAVGAVGDRGSVLEMDVSGLVVAPGFIDVHTHDDRQVLIQPQVEPKVTQGVTTVVTGNCGISLAPVILEGAVPAPLNLIGKVPQNFFASFADYATAVERAAPSVNVVPLVGHMALRASVGVDPDRGANDGEISQMQALLTAAFREGAFGFSTGLAYPLSHNAPMDEVVALAAIAAQFSGIYTTHMRDEGEGVLQSLEESFRTARLANVRLVVSHHKCLGMPAWGLSVQTLAAIDAAARSQAVCFDAYPYTASSTVLLPAKLRHARETWVTWSVPHPDASGRRVDHVAAEWRCTPEEAAERLAPAGAIYVNMDEEDVRRIMRHPLCMIGSDGLPHDTQPHPRLWGCFPRVLGHYARDVGLFSMEEAVHRMTGLPARRFGLTDRGTVRTGCYADLCVFDPATVRDRADFAHPTLPAAGIVHVVVNGRPVLRDGIPMTPVAGTAGPGRLIRGPGALLAPPGGLDP